MVSNQFFVNKGPFPLKKIVNLIKCNTDPVKIASVNISDIKNLYSAKKNDITFLNSNKYKENSLKTKATACVTLPNFSNLLPKRCIKLYPNNVLFAATQISKLFYPKDIHLNKNGHKVLAKALTKELYKVEFVDK